MTQDTGVVAVEILDGPSKFDLMVALFEGKRVEFKIAGQGRVMCQLNGVAVEDGSRQSWLIQGQLFYKMILNTYSSVSSNQHFSGHYETRCRKGNIDIGVRWQYKSF